MKHSEIFDKVKPGTTIYSTAQGHLLTAMYKLTEVHTQYTGERTYYTVLESLPAHSVFTDHGANEWFLTKEEAIKHGIECLEKKISEWQVQISRLKKL